MGQNAVLPLFNKSAFVKSHCQFAKPYFLNTVYREQFHESK